MNQPLAGKRVLIFVGDDYEDMELQYPKYRLLEAGAEVVVAGLDAGQTYHGKYGYPQNYKCENAEFKVPAGYIPTICSKPGKTIKYGAQGG